jgi:hypothetical protein
MSATNHDHAETNGTSSSSGHSDEERVRDAFSNRERDGGARHGPHDSPPWRGDPGLDPPALALPEPDDVRLSAVKLGQTMRAVSNADLEEHGGFFKVFYDGVAGIRINSVRIGATHLTAAWRKTRDTTKTREAIESAEGKRAGAQAQRLEAELPRFEADIQDTQDDIGAARDGLQHAEEALEVLRDDAAVAMENQAEAAKQEPEPTPTIAERIGLSGGKLLLLMVGEVIAALLQLEPALSKVISATFPLETYLIALTLALGLQLSAFAAGRLLAAVELPQRFVPLLFLACLGYALTNLIPELNQLREGSPSGETALTWVSLMIAVVAAATGWASAIRQAFERRLAVFRARPNRLEIRWNERITLGEAKVAEAQTGVEKAEALLEAAEAALDAHRTKITELLAIADDTPVRGMKERLVGEEAQADITTEMEAADTMVSSEEHHRDWSINIARLSWFKTRSEELCEPENPDHDVPTTGQLEQAGTHLPLVALAAILSLGAGAVAAGIVQSLTVLAALRTRPIGGHVNEEALYRAAGRRLAEEALGTATRPHGAARRRQYGLGQRRHLLKGVDTMRTPFQARLGAVIAAALAFAAAIVCSGCALTHTAAICPARATSITLTAITSPSDIGLSQQAGPGVAHQVAARAANECATLSTAVADAHPQGDLVLSSIQLTPSAKDAPNRVPWIAGLQRRAEAFLRQYFLKPLEAAHAQPTSPVLSTMAAIAAQQEAAGRRGGTIVETTDGFSVERAPDGGEIDFDRTPARKLKAQLLSFAPSLADLRGGCVILLGAGAHTHLGVGYVDEVRHAIGEVLHAAGVGFVWTRSLQVSETCPA